MLPFLSLAPPFFLLDWVQNNLFQVVVLAVWLNQLCGGGYSWLVGLWIYISLQVCAILCGYLGLDYLWVWCNWIGFEVVLGNKLEHHDTFGMVSFVGWHINSL